MTRGGMQVGSHKENGWVKASSTFHWLRLTGGETLDAYVLRVLRGLILTAARVREASRAPLIALTDLNSLTPRNALNINIWFSVNAPVLSGNERES